MLTPEIISCIERSVLCWLATANEHGIPNVSPKEMFAILDDEHLIIAQIASPKTVANLKVNPQECLAFIDIFVQK